MITHIVLCKFKAKTTKNEIRKVMSDVLSLKSKVRGITDIRWGGNFSKGKEGYTYAIVVSAKDRRTLDSFLNHPDHKLLAGWFYKCAEKLLVVDFKS